MPKGAIVIECKNFHLPTLFVGRIFRLNCWNPHTFIFTSLMLHRTFSL